MSTIVGYSLDEYLKMIEKFHGHPAPGLLIGGFMVDLAVRNRPAGDFYDVLCETAVCLPDAIQILTPCTYGNGWLKVVDIGRFALTMFEKRTGEGVRVYLDASRLDAWPEVKNWFLKLKPKQEQEKEKLLQDITTAGTGLLGMQRVVVDPGILGKKKSGRIGLCPSCGEAYPVRDGERCLACQGTPLYRE